MRERTDRGGRKHRKLKHALLLSTTAAIHAMPDQMRRSEGFHLLSHHGVDHVMRNASPIERLAVGIQFWPDRLYALIDRSLDDHNFIKLLLSKRHPIFDLRSQRILG